MSRYRKQRGAGFTLIEILVVIAIIGIVASLILVAITQAKQKAKGAVCISNLRQIGVALFSYASENGGYFPHIDRGGVPQSHANNFSWFDKIDEYWTDENLSTAKQCPLALGMGAGTTPDVHSYKMNERICWQPTGGYSRFLTERRAGRYPKRNLTSSGYYFFPFERCKKKAETVLIFDGRIDIPQVANQTAGINGSADAERHDGKTTILYFDGHVKVYDAEAKAGLAPGGLGWTTLGDLVWNPIKGVAGK